MKKIFDDDFEDDFEDEDELPLVDTENKKLKDTAEEEAIPGVPKLQKVASPVATEAKALLP